MVKRDYGMNVIDSTWESDIKKIPDGLIKKFKYQFYARSYHQLEGVDFFDTYSTIVYKTTIQLMIILEVILGIKSKQGGMTAAFL